MQPLHGSTLRTTCIYATIQASHVGSVTPALTSTRRHPLSISEGSHAEAVRGMIVRPTALPFPVRRGDCRPLPHTDFNEEAPTEYQ